MFLLHILVLKAYPGQNLVQHFWDFGGNVVWDCRESLRILGIFFGIFRDFWGFALISKGPWSGHEEFYSLFIDGVEGGVITNHNTTQRVTNLYILYMTHTLCTWVPWIPSCYASLIDIYSWEYTVVNVPIRSTAPPPTLEFLLHFLLHLADCWNRS